MREIIDRFQQLYFEKRTWLKTSWLGVPVLKCPLDLWIYQEIIMSIQPDVIVECGTAHGGSALFMASICDLSNKGRIITVDVKKNPSRPEHERIQYLHGSSTSREIFSQVKDNIHPGEKVLVILDSNHHCRHVLQELKLYHSLVTPDSYLIVEDTMINGHPVRPGSGEGPMEAVQAFLKQNDQFQVDRSREKFMLTFNPRGYLKRIK